MTNIRLYTKALGPALKNQIDQATSICILTSFVMNSGVAYLAKSLEKAARQGVDIKVCTGDYLYITQPDALEQLLAIHPNIEVRMWQSHGKSFHPKAYLVESSNQKRSFIGSSNLSYSALHTGVEWNVEVSGHEAFYDEVLDQFVKTFYSEATIPLNHETLKAYRNRYERQRMNQPSISHLFTEGEEMDLMLPDEEPVTESVLTISESTSTYEIDLKPRFAQVEALDQLERTVEEEYSKALVVMATGLGKTYLAAFFAKRYKRILFIAHLEEILHQAERSFQKVQPNKTTGIYNGKHKEFDVDYCFASIYTLSMDQHLKVFDPYDFDLIIVDEFHHAAANTYQKVLDYFKPNFLLGITATPDRNDNKDVFALCDGNVAFRLDFLEAIQREWLAPFHYYGVYDDTDYNQITWLGNRYAEDELLVTQLHEQKARSIYDAWQRHKQTKTVVFCSSIRQANFLCSFFKNQGVVAVCLHSNSKDNRNDVIASFTEGVIEVIFTVNLFNEGVDIPAIDTLLFVRPTESLTVFTQQLGRGLRLSKGKSHCVIIDLIGNYRNADVKLHVFRQGSEKQKNNHTNSQLPDQCNLNLDTKVISLLDEMKRKKQPRKELLKRDFVAVQQELGRRPTYVDLHLLGDINSSSYRQEYGSYVHFLRSNDELNFEETNIVDTYTDWIKEVEKTSMARSYKMVVLLSMLQRGEETWTDPITSYESAKTFSAFYLEKEYRFREFSTDKTKSNHWIYDRAKTAKKIEEMPMTKWSGSANGLLSFAEGTLRLGFDVPIEDRAYLYSITKEICDYRLHWYFERKGYSKR
ncbi:DNA helicase [Bacillaceae bacterium JMAK1]|nr:DNA helicase [Bacillaceae bacterium JMAK1]